MTFAVHYSALVAENNSKSRKRNMSCYCLIQIRFHVASSFRVLLENVKNKEKQITKPAKDKIERHWRYHHHYHHGRYRGHFKKYIKLGHRCVV